MTDRHGEWELPSDVEIELDRLLEGWSSHVQWRPQSAADAIIVLAEKLPDEWWSRRFAGFPFGTAGFSAQTPADLHRFVRRSLLAWMA